MPRAQRNTAAAIPHVLIMALVLGHVAFAGNRMTLTLLAIRLEASAFTVGLVMSLMMALPMLLAVAAGRWVDRIGFVRPTLLGLAMVLAASLLPALQPSLAAIYGSSILTGSGYMLAHIAINNAIGQRAGADRTRAFTRLALGFSVSGMLGPLLAGLLIDHAGHPAAFLALTVFPLASALVLVTRGQAHARPPAPAVVAAAGGGLLELLREPQLRAVFIVSGLLSTGWDLFTFLAPLHGARIGLSATAIGVVVAAFGAGAFAVRLAMPWLATRLGEWQTMGATLLVTAACYLVFPFVATAPLLIGIAFLLGLSLGCGQPMGMSLLHQTAPLHRSGEAVGFRSAITSASQTLMPLVFGALGTALGMVPVFWTAATILASGGAFASHHRDRAP